MKTLHKIGPAFLPAIALLAVITSSLGQGFFFQNVGGNGGARAAIYGPAPGNPLLQLWGNTPEATPPGTQSYSGPLVNGTSYSVEAWYTPSAVADPFQLLPQARAVNGSLTTFRLTALPGFFSDSQPEIPDANLSPDGFYTYLQVRAWDNAGGQLVSWNDAWSAAQAGSGRQVGWSTVFYQPLETRLIPWPGLVNFESFNLFIVPEPGVFSLLILALFCLRKRRPDAVNASGSRLLR